MGRPASIKAARTPPTTRFTRDSSLACVVDLCEVPRNWMPRVRTRKSLTPRPPSSGALSEWSHHLSPSSRPSSSSASARKFTTKPSARVTSGPAHNKGGVSAVSKRPATNSHFAPEYAACGPLCPTPRGNFFPRKSVYKIRPGAINAFAPPRLIPAAGCEALTQDSQSWEAGK